jgi:hypothetical protein
LARTADNLSVTIVPATQSWEAVHHDDELNFLSTEPIIAWAFHWRTDHNGRCKIVRREPITLSGRTVEAAAFLTPGPYSEGALTQHYLFLDDPSTVLDDEDELIAGFSERRERRKK